MGDIKRSEDETKQAGWFSKEKITTLAKRTGEYLSGNISENDWQNNPGLEPVWLEWLRELKII